MTRLSTRALLALAFVLMIVGSVAILRPAGRPLTQSRHVPIIGELPSSARLVRHEFSRHGFDYVHLFKFACSDATLRDSLVIRWRLRDLTESDEAPTSFMENAHPDWWIPSTPPASHRFGRSDEDSERYWSVWEQSESGLLYIEVGRW